MGTNITGIGNANAIGFKSRVTGGIYFPPELKDALVGVWSAYGKSNDSTDRNVIKNKIKDRGGDFVISNAAFKLNSGFGKYSADFESFDWTIGISQKQHNKATISLNGRLCNHTAIEVDEMKVNIIGNITELIYWYIANPDDTTRSEIRLTSGINTLPKSYAKNDGQTYNIGFAYISGDSEIAIEQIPQFQGAVVTDGVDDLIASTKTIEEMGITDAVTVVSMIHQIDLNSTYTIATTNYIENSNSREHVRSDVYNYGKTGIYGYSASLINNTKSDIKNILGDKADYYVKSTNSLQTIFDAKFSVVGRISELTEASQVAWYWTFIAKRVLTEDEINLVIEKYNLDRPGEIVKPDVYYDIKRQKITNENHSSFNNELIDFSGNGHNMKLYNLAWKGGSGIAAKKFETLNDWVISGESTITFVKHNEFSYTISTLRDNYWRVRINNSNYNTKKITIVVSKKCYWFGDLHYRLEGDTSDRIKTVTTLLQPNVPTEVSVNSYSDFEEIEGATLGACSSYVRALENNIEITVTIIPSYKGGLLLDGVDDYGKVTNVPIYKDYTIVAKYQRLTQQYVSGIGGTCPISKSHAANQGAFIMDAGTSNFAKTQCYSFGKLSSVLTIDNSNPEFHYQTKYIFDSQAIVSGDEVDSDSLWLGTFRDRDSRFFNGVIYSLMSFPYSLSEFLIERQINKARAGTLYPSQVEFRPIIPEDENITKIDYFVVNSGTWTVIKPGDYVDVGARIVLNVYTKLPYKVEKVSSPAFTGMSVRHSTELNIFDVEGYIKDKTPQKIKLTLAINEDIVQWNPAITSNLLDSFTASSWYLNGWDNTLTVGTWIKKTDRIFFKATFKTELYGLETATFGGAECVVSKADNWSDSKNIWDIRMLGTVGDLSQVFNLDVYELIRFEDIVQPYPSFYEFIDENKNLITWGSKIKVGSTITRTKGFFDSNLLKGLYTISYPKLNGVEASGSKYVVEKSMVFTCTATWIFDNNEPKCVLSPDRLQIPNSSYRILKHIPDISGHGNHGKINNSAYAEMSGANGYPYNYNNEEFAIQPGSEIINDTTFITHKLVPNVGMIKNTPLYKGKIKITGLNNKLALHVYAKGYLDSETINSYKIYKDGIYDINIVGVTEVIYFHVVSLIDDVQNRDVNVTIQQIGEYEGSFCLDGVDDFVSIPTTVGGKQVLMKVNWNTSNIAILYDQRGYNNEFAIYNGMKDSDGNPVPAYQGRNNGQTYIDGILNSNIKASELKAIAHNITITNELSSGTNKTYPVIGSSKANAYFVNMALYDFMLFDEISTDDKIKELNEYIGIEKNVFAINPNISIDTPETVKDIKIYQGGEEISSGYLYLNKDTEFEIYVSLNTGKYSLDTITVDGVEITKDRVVGEYNIFKFTLNGSSEQNITIHSYEYIMYEDIVQPYPVLLRFNDKNGNEVSWGGKFKVGSTITRIGSIADPESNLLNGLYSISGLSLNGKAVTSSTSIVEKQMVFRTTATWLLGDNEPKCIFSPSKLRMPNESYRYLGYIPDISGNGNNGVFNNFAFSKMSGVNGYLEDFTTLRDYGIKGIVRTDSKIYLDESFDYDKGFWLGYTNVPSPAYKVKISGIPETGMLTYTGGVWLNLTNGINELPARTNTAENHGFVVQSPNLDWSNLVIEQIPEYEGSICFDGVDDYITIPTLSEGGKQVLMKVNWQKQDTMLYNQNPGQDNFAIFANDYNNNNLVVAYASRNNGNTYIDGVVNNNILATQLKGITHNIVATNNNIDATITPIIGSNKNHDNFFAQMALYAFMLFDEISTDEEIKELNNIVGIEGDYVQKPSYYWDAYGKTNFDIDKDIIPQRGTEKGYNLGNFTTNWYYKTDSNSVSIVTRSPYSVTLRRLEGTNDFEFRNTELKSIASPVTVKFRPNKDIGFIYDYHYRKVGESGEGPVLSKGVKMIANEEFTFSVNPVSQDDIDKYNIDVSTGYYMLYFRLNTFAVDEEVTIEMLPVEGGKSLALTNNNFAYDKMSGYGGYSFKSFNDSQDSWNIRGDGTGVEIVSRDGYSMTVKKLVQNLDWNISNNEYKYPTILNKELPFKCKSNKNVGLIWQLKYKTEGATADTTVTLLNQQLTPNVPLEVSLPYKTQDELTELGAVSTSVYYLLYFSNTLLEIGEEYTIEMLPLYPNGLVFDGVDDYSENTSIPALADYTYICKRSILNIPTNGATLLKGSHKTNGGAFIADYGNKWQFNFGQYNTIQGIVDGINWQTTNNFNGTPINKGNNTDDEGITVGRFSNGYTNMVFYKLFLYPRTIDMLSINMVKNMMEEDGIIDLTSKLFTDKYTGDFYEMDFNNDFLIGN